MSSFRQPAVLRLALLALPLLVLPAIGSASASSRATPVLPTKYRFVHFDYPGAVGTTLFGINDAGQVVGFYSRTSSIAGDIRNKPVQGFVLIAPTMKAARVVAPAALRKSKKIINLVAVGIAQDGRAVGGFTDDKQRNYGFVRSKNGKKFTIINDPQSNGTNAFGVNAAGTVSGFYFDKASPPAPSANDRIVHGFIRLANGKFRNFDDPQGKGKTFASGIDNLGRVAGHYVDKAGGVHAFVRSATGKFANFDHPQARQHGGGSCAQAINRIGEVAGFFFTAKGTHGYVRSADGKHFNVIDDPKGVGKTYVFGINDAGQVVGYYVDAKGDNHGFIATPIAG